MQGGVSPGPAGVDAALAKVAAESARQGLTPPS